MSTKNPCITTVTFSGLVILALALFSTAALAQSSGNFTASVQTSQCVINTVGGQPNSGSLSGGGTLLDTYIQTPSSKFTSLIITPSIVTGLFNNTQVTSTMPTSANSAAVVVTVTLDGKAVLPEIGGPTATGIIYDERFQQLSTNIFDKIQNCQMADPQCNIGLVLSTLAAHSFNFVANNVGGGVHPLKVTWQFQCTDTNGNPTPCSTAYVANTAGACAGPGTVTVVQTKAFTQSGGVVVQ